MDRVTLSGLRDVAQALPRYDEALAYLSLSERTEDGEHQRARVDWSPDALTLASGAPEALDGPAARAEAASRWVESSIRDAADRGHTRWRVKAMGEGGVCLKTWTVRAHRYASAEDDAELFGSTASVLPADLEDLDRAIALHALRGVSPIVREAADLAVWMIGQSRSVLEEAMGSMFAVMERNQRDAVDQVARADARADALRRELTDALTGWRDAEAERETKIEAGKRLDRLLDEGGEIAHAVVGATLGAPPELLRILGSPEVIRALGDLPPGLIEEAKRDPKAAATQIAALLRSMFHQTPGGAT